MGQGRHPRRPPAARVGRHRDRSPPSSRESGRSSSCSTTRSIVEYGPTRDRDVRRRDLARPAVPSRGVRREDGLWAVAARRIEVVELPGVDGHELELSRHDDERTLIVDGSRSFGSIPRAGARRRLRRPRPAPGRRSLGDRGVATLGGECLPHSAHSKRFCAPARAGALKRIAEQAEYVLSLQPEFEKLSDAELAGQEGRVQAAARERRVARGAALRGVRGDPRGLPPRPPGRALQGAGDGRHRPPRGRHRRDEDRRGQDVRRHAAALPQLAAGDGRAPRHGQRLPRQARRRVDALRVRAARRHASRTSRT